MTSKLGTCEALGIGKSSPTTKSYNHSDDGSGMSAGELWVETSGGLEGEGSGFDPGGF